MYAIWLRARTVCRKEVHLDLLLLDTALRRLLDVRPDCADVAAVGSRGRRRDGNGLDQELVSAASVRGRLLFHCLQQDLDFDIAAGLDAATVGADAVPAFVLVGAVLDGGGWFTVSGLWS